VSTAFRQGWDKLTNGELLAAAEQAGFDVFVTTDKNMSYRQNLANRAIAIVVLSEQQWLGPASSALWMPSTQRRPEALSRSIFPSPNSPCVSHCAARGEPANMQLDACQMSGSQWSA
jgi:hypothetical protein